VVKAFDFLWLTNPTIEKPSSHSQTISMSTNTPMSAVEGRPFRAASQAKYSGLSALVDVPRRTVR